MCPYTLRMCGFLWIALHLLQCSRVQSYIPAFLQRFLFRILGKATYQEIDPLQVLRGSFWFNQIGLLVVSLSAYSCFPANLLLGLGWLTWKHGDCSLVWFATINLPFWKAWDRHNHVLSFSMHVAIRPCQLTSWLVKCALESNLLHILLGGGVKVKLKQQSSKEMRLFSISSNFIGYWKTNDVVTHVLVLREEKWAVLIDSRHW